MKLKAANRARIIAAAKEMYADPSNDDIEVMDDAEIDYNDARGMWVTALVYVRPEDLAPKEVQS